MSDMGVMFGTYLPPFVAIGPIGKEVKRLRDIPYDGPWAPGLALKAADAIADHSIIRYYAEGRLTIQSSRGFDTYDIRTGDTVNLRS